jgi:cardiolipin synthase
MSLIRVAIPVSRGKRRFHLDKGRTWSVVEHLILHAVVGKGKTVQVLADESLLPPRVIIEALIRLMDAGWVEFSQLSDGIHFRATDGGKLAAVKGELPTHPRRITRWRSFITDRLTGTIYRSREFSLFEKHVLEQRAEREPLVWIEPRSYSAEDQVRSLVDVLFDDDERFISMDASGERLVDRFAVVTYRNGRLEGLPRRAPQELEEVSIRAAQSFKPSNANINTYLPQPTATDVRDAALKPRQITFKMDDLIMGAAQHRNAFEAAIKTCRHHLVIHSTFISHERVEELLPSLFGAVKRGVRIDVLWGHDDERTEVSTTKAAVSALRQHINKTSFGDQFFVHPFSTGSHAKIIVADVGSPKSHFAIVGSCNWLSSNLQSFEGSIRLREPNLVAETIYQLAELSLGSEGHWTSLTNYLARLANDVRAEFSPPGAQGYAHLVLGPDHGAMVRRARDELKRRAFVTSHRISSAARPAVVLPLIAAVEKNTDLEARIYYGIPSGKGEGVRAAELTMEAGSSGIRVRPVREPRVHAKLLAWDDDYLVISSQNWLSADPSEANKRKEIGVFINAPNVARNTIDYFEAMRKS